MNNIYIILIILIIICFSLYLYFSESFTDIKLNLKKNSRTSNISKIIFTYYNNLNLPDYAINCIKTWFYHNPDYQIVLLTDDNLDQWDISLPTYTFDKSRDMKKDFIKLTILQKYGAIWLDINTICTGCLDPLLYLDPIQNMVIYECYGNVDPFFIATRPKNLFMTYWYSELLTCYKDNNDYLIKYGYILDTLVENNKKWKYVNNKNKDNGINLMNLCFHVVVKTYKDFKEVPNNVPNTVEIFNTIKYLNCDNSGYYFSNMSEWNSNKTIHSICKYMDIIDNKNIGLHDDNESSEDKIYNENLIKGYIGPIIKLQLSDVNFLINNKDYINCIFGRYGSTKVDIIYLPSGNFNSDSDKKKENFVENNDNDSMKIFSSENSKIIPKIIWTYYYNDVSDILRLCMNTWSIHNSDYKIIVLNENNLSKWKINIDNNIVFKNFHEKSNFIRLNVLKEYGGVWLDPSIIINCSLNDIIFQEPDKNFVIYYCDRYTIDKKYPVFDSFFIAATKNNSFINKWLFEYTTAYDNRTKYLETYHMFLQGIDINNDQLLMKLSSQVVLRNMLSTGGMLFENYSVFTAENGPYFNLYKTNWDSFLSLVYLCKQQIPKTIIKLTNEQLKILFEDIGISNCIFSKIMSSTK